MGKQRCGAWPLFCKRFLSSSPCACFWTRLTDHVWIFQGFKNIPNAILESAWPDGGICNFAQKQGKRCPNGKNEYKQVDTWSYSMFVAILHNIVPRWDWGRSGKASPFSPGKQRHRAWPLCAKVSHDESFDLSVAPRIAFMASSYAFHSTAWPPCQLSLKPCHLATDLSSSHESLRETSTGACRSFTCSVDLHCKWAGIARHLLFTDIFFTLSFIGLQEFFHSTVSVFAIFQHIQDIHAVQSPNISCKMLLAQYLYQSRQGQKWMFRC